MIRLLLACFYEPLVMSLQHEYRWTKVISHRHNPNEVHMVELTAAQNPLAFHLEETPPFNTTVGRTMNNGGPVWSMTVMPAYGSLGKLPVLPCKAGLPVLKALRDLSHGGTAWLIWDHTVHRQSWVPCGAVAWLLVTEREHLLMPNAWDFT